MTHVPEGWYETTLGELGRYLNGRGFKKSEWRDSGLPIIRIQNLTGSNRALNYYQGETDERYYARQGDLLISWAATLGAYIWSGPDAVVNQHIFKVESFIDVSFHKHLLDYKLEELMRKAHGTGMVHVTRAVFDAIPVMLPRSRATQAAIVERLEFQLSSLDAARTSVVSVHERLNRLVASVLLNDWAVRAAPTTTLKSVLMEGLSNGRSVLTRDDGFPVLRLNALVRDGIDLTQRKGGDWTAEEASQFRVARGDFLVSRGNGSLRLVGRGGLVRDEPDAVAYPDTLIRIRPDENKIAPEYLATIWNSPLVRRQIESVARTTAGIYKVNQGHLQAVTFPLPDLPDQLRIVESVRSATDSVKDLRRAVEASERREASLRRVVLASAFAGTPSPENEATEQEMVNV